MRKFDLHIFFWGYAFEAIAYLLNKIPSKYVDKSPYKIWKRKSSNLSHLRILGCTAYAKSVQLDNMKDRSVKCKFVGYPRESFGYHFYNPEEQKVFASKHVVFLEK